MIWGWLHRNPRPSTSPWSLLLLVGVGAALHRPSPRTCGRPRRRRDTATACPPPVPAGSGAHCRGRVDHDDRARRLVDPASARRRALYAGGRPSRSARACRSAFDDRRGGIAVLAAGGLEFGAAAARVVFLVAAPSWATASVHGAPTCARSRTRPSSPRARAANRGAPCRRRGTSPHRARAPRCRRARVQRHRRSGRRSRRRLRARPGRRQVSIRAVDKQLDPPSPTSAASSASSTRRPRLRSAGRISTSRSRSGRERPRHGSQPSRSRFRRARGAPSGRARALGLPNHPGSPDE